MIRPDVKLEEWLAKTGLEPEHFTCPKCYQEFKTIVPVISKDYFGLESPIHDCGPNFTALVVTARSKEKKALWAELMDNF